MATRGSILRKDKPGQAPYWEVTISLGKDKFTGRRIGEYKSCKTEKDAQRWLTQRLREIDQGTAVARTGMTVKELMEFWLDTYAVPGVSPVTLSSYEDTIRVHIVPAIGNIAIQDLKPMHLSKLYAKKLSEGTGPRTIQLIHLRLQQALKYAVQHELLARNVCEAVKPPKVRQKERTIWSPQEVQSFLSMAVDSSYGPIYVVSLYSGMRRGELLGLRWSDILWDQSAVQIRQTAGKVRGKMTIKPGAKTTAGRRVVTLPSSVMSLLREHRTKQLAVGHYRKDGLVFTSDKGTVITPSNLARQADRLMAKAGVPRITLHEQRHTHISQLLMQGVNIKLVSERAGHASPSVTLDVYSHVTQEAHREVADKVDTMFGTRQITRQQDVPESSPDLEIRKNEVI
jgi:integrase